MTPPDRAPEPLSAEDVVRAAWAFLDPITQQDYDGEKVDVESDDIDRFRGVLRRWDRERALDAARDSRPVGACGGCGGPHRFDTSVPSPLWNEVIRAAGLSDYLCTSCIVEAFVNAGRSFEAELYGDTVNREGNHVPVIRVQVDDRPLDESYGDLQAQLRERDSRPVGEGLDVERLARAWLNAMTDGEHNAGCLDQGAMDCPVAAEVREFAPKVAAEYRRLADAGPVGDRDQFRLSMRHIVAANAILDRPSADPDDDAALVARAVLRLADPDLLSTDQPASTEAGEDG